MIKGTDRIIKNEERLDAINAGLDRLEDVLNEWQDNKKKLRLLNQYYGSKSWFQDKEDYENGRIPKVKAGVLSEDAVWNLNEKFNEIMEQMESLIKEHTQEKNK